MVVMEVRVARRTPNHLDHRMQNEAILGSDGPAAIASGAAPKRAMFVDDPTTAPASVQRLSRLIRMNQRVLAAIVVA